MRSKLLNKRISAVSLMDSMDDKERYYVVASYQCPEAEDFQELKEDFSYNYFMNKVNHNKKLKRKILKETSKESINYVVAELLEVDFCAMDFVLSLEMKEGDCISGVKYGIYSVILDNRLPELVEKYIKNEIYEDKLAAVEGYLEARDHGLPLAILTVIIYLTKNKEDLEDIEEELELKLLDYYGQWVYEEYTERVAHTLKELAKSRREKDNLLNELKEHKEKNKALREENNRLVKMKSQFADILKEINKSIKATSEIYPKALKETIAFKKDVSESNFNSIITNLTLQVSDLRIVNKELKDKNKDLEGRASQLLEKNKELSWELDKIKGKKKSAKNKEDINSSIDEDIDQGIEEGEALEPLKPSYPSEPLHQSDSPSPKKAPDNESRRRVKTATIGYCEIKDGVHYIVFTDGTRRELTDILSRSYERSYLAQGQFIKIDSNGNILHIYNGYADKTIIGVDLVEARYFNGDYYFMIDDEEVQINIGDDIKLSDHMVFAVDKERNIKILFKPVKFNLDFFVESIKAKGHKLYYIFEKSGNGVKAREVLTGDETFLPGSCQDCKEGAIVVFGREREPIHVMPNGKFYTSSNYYREGKEAEVQKYQGELYYKLKDCGKLIAMGETTKAVGVGDIVVLDENNNVIEYPEEVKKHKEIKENKKTPQEEVEAEDDNITITHRVLIVGELAFSNSYKLSFLKKGYHADIVDGFESFNKISLKLKNIDCIIVISNHISHGNMWSLKEGQIPVIYPVSDGANRVLEEFEEFIKNRVEECS
ncbi:hypothetical protein ACPWSR_13865 [Alloiococcus sp. CFN-8]|uniref:hypothetical protein n=1 Tax=Alloiococcus sp. CFN-8 TaxID=3416081 RepID=UPI003CF64A45